jgi:hypothetical protein
MVQLHRRSHVDGPKMFTVPLCVPSVKNFPIMFLHVLHITAVNLYSKQTSTFPVSGFDATEWVSTGTRTASYNAVANLSKQ